MPFLDEMNFDVILQAGQSNSEGYGLGPVDKEYRPCDDIYYLCNDFTVAIADYYNKREMPAANLALSFARRYVDDGRLKQSRKLLIIRAAVGGTGFSDNRWKPKDDLCIIMHQLIKYALNMGGDNRLVGFIWHQGETDSILNADYDTHYKNLSTLLEGVRGKYGAGLPFIAGDFVHEWKNKNLDICRPVVDAMKAVCAGNKAAFIETDGLSSNNMALGNEDDIHFSRQALHKLGERYYKAFCDIAD